MKCALSGDAQFGLPIHYALPLLGVYLNILNKVEFVRNSRILHHANVLCTHVYADAGGSTDRSFQLLGYLPVVISDADIDVHVPHRIYGIQSNVSNKTGFIKFVKIRRPKTGDAGRSSAALKRIDYLFRAVTSLHPFHAAAAEGFTQVCGLYAAGQRRAREYKDDSHDILLLEVVFSIHRCCGFATHDVSRLGSTQHGWHRQSCPRS